MKQRQPWRVPKGLTFFSALLLAWQVTLPTPAVAQQAIMEDDLREVFKGLQNGTVPPALVSRECELSIQNNPDVADMKRFIAAYLQVPEGSALSAACDAVILAIKDGEITVETLILINRQNFDAPKAAEIGRLLRVIYFRHQATSTAALDAEAAQ